VSSAAITTPGTAPDGSLHCLGMGHDETQPAGDGVADDKTSADVVARDGSEPVDRANGSVKGRHRVFGPIGIGQRHGARWWLFPQEVPQVPLMGAMQDRRE
jgi:hypothetical protein